MTDRFTNAPYRDDAPESHTSAIRTRTPNPTAEFDDEDRSSLTSTDALNAKEPAKSDLDNSKLLFIEQDPDVGEQLSVPAAGIATFNNATRGPPPPDPSPNPTSDSRKQEARVKVSWSELPRKDQLAILTIARLSEPLTQTGLQSYMFYQLKSFKLPDGSSPSDSTVAMQVGLLAAAFTGAQFLTAMLWGRLADWEGMGRKRVILVGLLGTAIGSLGFGFSQSFGVAMFWRATGGILNGNVGVMRTMISETVKEKKYQSRAFLLLPMTFNIGVIIGPLLGGLLADPVTSYPQLFGPGSTFGGEDGVWLFMKWPYALPNLVNATFLFMSTIAILLGLEETLEALQGPPDYGLRLGKFISRILFRQRASHEYTPLGNSNDSIDTVELQPKRTPKPLVRGKLPFRRIWTSNVLTTFLCSFLLYFTTGSFNSLWFLFLSTPRYTPSTPPPSTSLFARLPPSYRPTLPFTFTGGLGMPPSSIGTALAILGVIGITLQLFLYPPLSFLLGTIRSLRFSMLLFPLAYFVAPYLAIVPSSSAAPAPASGILVWTALTAILAIQVSARTFALPSNVILVNNCSPHPSVLGTVHGMAQSVASAAKTIGPLLFTSVYAWGLSHGVVGAAWWCMAAAALLGAVASRVVKEGDGHEIWLPGEKDGEEGEEEEEEEAGEGELEEAEAEAGEEELEEADNVEERQARDSR